MSKILKDGSRGDGTQHCIEKRLEERWNAQAAKEAVVKAPAADAKAVDKSK